MTIRMGKTLSLFFSLALLVPLFILSPSGVSAAPAVSGLSFSDAVGQAYDGQTVIGLGAPSDPAHTFRYILSTDGNAVSAPNLGDDVSAWTAVSDGDRIIAADGQHVGVAEVDGSNRVVAFSNAQAVVVLAKVQLLSGQALPAADFETVQAAVDAAVDGDTVAIGAGTFREQVTVTKAITLQGAGVDQTVIEAPDSADLQQSSDWKNLKAQKVYAVIGVKASGEVTVKNLTVDGRDQGKIEYYYTLANPIYNYSFNGIAVLDTTATVDSVKITGIRDLSTQHNAFVPAGYEPADQPSGANHNESIFAESKDGAGAHTVTVKNSTITKFQKTGILAWGPTLTVDIRDNTIQGYGQTLYSTGNGIQIASSDRSSYASGDPANGDRRGTTGTISGNKILGIGLVIPEPGQQESYFNPGLGDPSGIILYEAGNGIVIESNEITGAKVFPWYDSYLSNAWDDGIGYGHTGVDLVSSPNVIVRNNEISDFAEGIVLENVLPGAPYSVSGNSFSGNHIDIWSPSGNSSIALADGADTIGYAATGLNLGAVSGFGLGDRINVVGFVAHSQSNPYVGSVNGYYGTIADRTISYNDGGTLYDVPVHYSDGQLVVDFTGGSVTEGDGTNVAARSIQVAAGAVETVLYVDTDGDTGQAELEIKLDGVYSVDNFRLSGGYIEFVAGPMSAVYTPAHNASAAAVDSDLQLQFNESVTAVSGKKITVKLAEDDSVVETIDAADTMRVTVNGSGVTIDLSKDLLFGTGYYVEMDAGAFAAVSGQSVSSGLTGSTAWSFATEIRSEVNAADSYSLKHYLTNAHVDTINLQTGAVYDLAGGTISRELTINGNGATIIAGLGVADVLVRSEGVIVSKDPPGNDLTGQAFLRVEGVGSKLVLKDVTLQNGTDKNGSTNADDGILAVINIKTGGSLEADHVALKGFHNNPTPGNNQSFGIHAEPGAVSTVIKDSLFDSSNAFRNAIAVRRGAVEISGNTFRGTDYPLRLRQSDGYEYAMYIYGGTGSITTNTITGYDSTTQQGYASAGIAVIGFYPINLTIEGNNLDYNESGIDITKTWTFFSTNTQLTVNGMSVDNSEVAFILGEKLKLANMQDYVSVSLDQTDEVKMQAGTAGSYYSVMGGYRSPLIFASELTAQSVKLSFAADTGTADALQAATSVGFEVQRDNETSWTAVSSQAITWTQQGVAVLNLEQHHTYRIRAVMTHNSATDTVDNVMRNLITYSNPLVLATVTADDDLDVLAGADASMEYSTDGGVNWTSYDPAEAPTFAGAKTVLVRTAASSTALAGEAIAVSFTANKAELTGVAGQTTATAGGGDGSAADKAITWIVNVPNSTAKLALADVTTVTGATYQLYTDSSFTAEITGASTVDLTAGGGTTVYVKVTAQDGVTAKYYAVTINRAETLTYSIVLSETGNHSFGTATTGYTGPTAYSVTVSNTGTSPTGELTVILSGTNASDFTLSKTEVSDLAAGGSDSFTVAPKSGLAVGSYTATVTVSGASFTAQHFTVSFAVLPSLSNDAGLTSIAGQTTAAAGGGDGSAADKAITWTVNVTKGTATLALADITTVTGATYQLYTDSSFTAEITGASTVALTAGRATTVYVKVTAQDGVTAKYYAVTIKRAETSSSTSSGGSSSTTSGTNTDSGVNVYVNGKAESAGTATVKNVDGRTVTTIDVNQQKLEAKLAAEGKDAVVTVMMTKPSDVLIGQLNGEMIQKMEQQQASLELRTTDASYNVPSLQLNIQSLAEKLGADQLKDVTLQISIAETGADKLKVVADAAAAGNFTVVVPSIDFTVHAKYGDMSIEITDYKVYVQRMIAIPEGVDRNKVTTGVVVEADGTVRHIPTQVEVMDGMYYAVINSLTNSTYSVVWHPLEFADAAGHWGQNAINDMGSRMVIEGVGAASFEPDRDITRAEFAAILARGLGLRLNPYHDAPFSDVAAKDWYAQVVQTAFDYQLIAGYEDGTFRPEEKITRQEAMTIIAKAMRITGLKEKLTGVSGVLSAYQDQGDIATWAYEAVTDCVTGGLVAGRSSALMAPEANMTRAEVAAIVQRLLQKSELI
ncbi:DUF4073 domain-containing protein [Paenibacillus sp. y28]|uniref:DUF4073 domain-containing protein n=1 Tax=Paenibacillus sp. y28 TaxID=3129110 RepID=UPI003016C20E